MHVPYFPNLLDSVYHIEAHFDAAVWMIRSGLREPRYAVVTVAQKFDPKAMVL